MLLWEGTFYTDHQYDAPRLELNHVLRAMRLYWPDVYARIET